MAVKKEKFGVLSDKREVTLYEITNENGVTAAVTDLGATWVKMLVPDRSGAFSDVLLGFDDAEGYAHNGPHFGTVVGRVANRTSKGRFILEGKEYRLDQNDGENNLHSGLQYFEKRLWESFLGADGKSVVFSLESPDKDQGFPGNAKISVTYRLTDDNAMEITYDAVCDQATPMNLTNHAYFNLGGHNSGSVESHVVQILADFFTMPTIDSIPTGEILKVEGTPMDFRTPMEIGARINTDYFPLNQGGGYDHNWCLNHEAGVFGLAAVASHRESGRVMEVYTDLPGVQLYTGNFLDGEKGKEGSIYGKRSGFCFETQFYPDAINKPHFPSPVIGAGEAFRTKTAYRFRTEK